MKTENGDPMNTEQLKTAEEILISKVGKLALSGLKWKSLNDRKQLIIEAMQDFASQESKRAVDEFKEKLKREIREKSIVLYDASARFALVDGLNTMIDKL